MRSACNLHRRADMHTGTQSDAMPVCAMLCDTETCLLNPLLHAAVVVTCAQVCRCRSSLKSSCWSGQLAGDRQLLFVAVEHSMLLLM
jgi:hypothetical protein